MRSTLVFISSRSTRPLSGSSLTRSANETTLPPNVGRSLNQPRIGMTESEEDGVKSDSRVSFSRLMR